MKPIEMTEESQIGFCKTYATCQDCPIYDRYDTFKCRAVITNGAKI